MRDDAGTPQLHLQTFKSAKKKKKRATTKNHKQTYCILT